MSAITVTLTGICTGGNHLTFSITGDKVQTVPVNLSELSAPIDEQDVVAFCKVIARMAKNGRTIAQARTLLQAGVGVTV